ncbi:AB hydrolase-1 domain-containing protein [Trichoderma simmonsii]|uniref:AB hydrolase-1 domain-containing protein n=1 Tax=Trichoderma simmonsii TaxID=1491479 RepID=A0A8G0LQU9_9HYPO|nr:AB hydrolase-1 domain-containing protein [Trichoderma simmonsii]
MAPLRCLSGGLRRAKRCFWCMASGRRALPWAGLPGSLCGRGTGSWSLVSQALSVFCCIFAYINLYPYERGEMTRLLLTRRSHVDLFGRGYSDGPSNAPYDECLYTTQILLVLASSSLSWTGASSFHLLGYSLGGALAAAFAAYHSHMLRSLTVVCPGGLVRESHLSWKSRLLYSHGVLPEWLLRSWVRARIAPQHGQSADVPDGDEAAEVNFDDVTMAVGRNSSVRVGDVVGWQLDANPAFVDSYMSTIRYAPIYGQHDKMWAVLGEQLAANRELGQGLQRVCVILGDKDTLIIKDEWIEDTKTVLGEDGVEVCVISGGHEIAISKGKEVADVAMSMWKSSRHGSSKSSKSTSSGGGSGTRSKKIRHRN